MLGECRHFLFLTPLAAISAAPVLHSFFLNREHKKIVLIVAFIAAIISIITGNWVSIWTFGFILLMISIRYVIDSTSNQKVVIAFVVAFILVLLIRPITDIRTGEPHRYRAQKNLVQEFFANANEQTIVITNAVQKHFGEYYQGFRRQGAPRWISYAQAADYVFRSEDEVYVLINWATRGLSGLNYFDVPLYARHIPDDFEHIYSKSEIGLELYRVKSTEDLNTGEELVLHETNSFEQSKLRWSDYSEAVSTEYFHSGSLSNVVPARGFSAAYQNPLLELVEQGIDQVHVICKIKIRAEDVSEVELVLAIDEGKENKHWCSAKGNEIKSTGDGWWLAVLHEELILSELSPSVMSCYVWNRSNKEVYVDDYELELLKY